MTKQELISSAKESGVAILSDDVRIQMIAPIGRVFPFSMTHHQSYYRHGWDEQELNEEVMHDMRGGTIECPDTNCMLCADNEKAGTTIPATDMEIWYNPEQK